MKKNRHIILFIFLAVLLVITGINEVFDLVQCNMRRTYKSMEDRDIQKIKDKISFLFQIVFQNRTEAPQRHHIKKNMHAS